MFGFARPYVAAGFDPAPHHLDLSGTDGLPDVHPAPYHDVRATDAPPDVVKGHAP